MGIIIIIIIIIDNDDVVGSINVAATTVDVIIIIINDVVGSIIVDATAVYVIIIIIMSLSLPSGSTLVPPFVIVNQQGVPINQLSFSSYCIAQ